MPAINMTPDELREYLASVRSTKPETISRPLDYNSKRDAPDPLPPSALAMLQSGTYKGHYAYEFRTLEDILALPISKVADFLKDLSMWVAMHKAAALMPSDMVKLTNPRDVFEWIDDGAHIMRVNSTKPDGSTETMQWDFGKGATP